VPSPSTLAAFALSSLLLILLPGPAMLFLVARGIAGGRRVGALSALGIEAATAVYVLATALGLTAVLAASTLAFSIVRYAGAAYLVLLGVRTILDRRDPEAPTVSFFLAFFPQFIHPDAGSVATQVLVLGAVIVAIGTVLDVSYGVLGGLARARLSRRSSAARRGRVAVGLTYIGLGGLTAATGQRAA